MVDNFGIGAMTTYNTTKDAALEEARVLRKLGKYGLKVK